MAGAVAGTKARPIVNVKPALFAMLAVLCIMITYRIYQQINAFSAGLDSTDPLFETYWMTLLKVELPVLVCSWAVMWSWLWFTRDRNLNEIKPREEMRRYFNLVLFIMVYAWLPDLGAGATGR